MQYDDPKQTKQVCIIYFLFIYLFLFEMLFLINSIKFVAAQSNIKMYEWK
jgi:hypothetical protein